MCNIYNNCWGHTSLRLRFGKETKLILKNFNKKHVSFIAIKNCRFTGSEVDLRVYMWIFFSLSSVSWVKFVIPWRSVQPWSLVAPIQTGLVGLYM